jgi:hypothetical protein
MKTALASLLFGSLVSFALAHDTWMQPTKFVATPGAAVTLEMTSAAGFVGPESAIKAWRISRAIAVVGGDRFFIKDLKESEKSLVLTTTLPKPGVAVLAVDLKPRLLELEPGKIEEYFHEIHAGPDLRALWDQLPAPKRWRENYTKHSKTFIRVGDPKKDDRAWAEPLGLVLEIVPEKDPTLLHAGEEISVRVLRSGIPFSGFALGFVSAGETREHVAVTDEQGRAKAVLDASGPWLIHGTDLRRSIEPGLEWESDFVTMVVEAK